MATLGGACLLARAKLATYVGGLRSASATEKFTTAARAGFLASAKTFERNIVGNSTKALGEYLLVRPTAVAIDHLTAVLKSAKSFGRVQPHEVRTIANTLNLEGAKQGLKGVAEYYRQAKEMLRTGIDPQAVGDKFDLHQVTFDNPVTDRLVRGVYDVMEAADKPFFGFAFQTDLYGRARLMALREGLKGDAATMRVNELLANPTPEMTLGATAQAMEDTFKNKTWGGELGSKIKSFATTAERKAAPGFKPFAKAGKLLVDFSIPFTHVASSITNAAVETSPFGFVKAALQSLDPNPAIQAQVKRQLARASLGTALTAIGFELGRRGQITGAYPTKPAEARQWEIEGKQPYSVKVNGTWRNIMALGPYAIPMFMGQVLAQEGMSSQGVTEALASTGKTITEQSFLSGMSNTIDALRGEKDPSSAIASFVPIPPIVGQIAAAVDPVQRQAQSVRDRIVAKIPFASRSLPPRLSQFGDTLTRNRGGATGAFESLVDITNPRQATETPLTREMDRLGVNVSSLGKSLQIGKERIQRTPQKYNALLAEFGPIKRGVLEQLIASPDYQQATDDEKAQAIENVMRSVGRSATQVDKARRLKQDVPPLSLKDFL